MRRIVVCTLLLVGLTVSAVGWPHSPPEPREVDSSVILTSPPGLAIEAALSARADLLSSSWTEHRVLKVRPRLALPVSVGLGMLLTVGMVTLVRLAAGRCPTLWRRRSVALRAPPRLRLT